MSKRGKSRGRASWPYDSVADGVSDRNDPNWPYGPPSAKDASAGPSRGRRGAPSSVTPGPKRTFVREASPEFVPGPEPEPEESRPISPNESMLSMTNLDQGADEYEDSSMQSFSPRPAAPPPPSPSFQIIRTPMRPRFVSPPTGRPRPRPGATPFNAAPFSPMPQHRGVLRPVRRPGASPVANRGSRFGSPQMSGIRMFRGPPPPNLRPISPASSSRATPTSGFGSGIVQVESPLATRFSAPKNSPSPTASRTPRGGGGRGGANPQRGSKSTGKGRRGGVKASSSSPPVEIALDSDDDDLEIIDEKRLTHKPVEKSPLEILVEQHKAKEGSRTSDSKDAVSKNGFSKSAVRSATPNDSRKRFPDWSSADEASPAKAARRQNGSSSDNNDDKKTGVKPSAGPASSKTASSKANSKNNDAANPESAPPSSTKTLAASAPARRKLTEIQFQERRQLLLCSWPDATEKSIRRAVESTETTEEAEDWFFKFGERKPAEVKRTTDTPVSKSSVKEEGKKDSMMNGKADDDDDDVVPLDSDGEDADGTDDEEKRERVLTKIKVPSELDGRMKQNLFYFKQEMARESKTYDELMLKRALAKFNWKIDDAVRYLKFGHKKKRCASSSSSKPVISEKSSSETPSNSSVSSTPPTPTSSQNTSASVKQPSASPAKTPTATPQSETAKSPVLNGDASNPSSSPGSRGANATSAGSLGQRQRFHGPASIASSENNLAQNSNASSTASKTASSTPSKPAVNTPAKPGDPIRTVVEPIAISDDEFDDSKAAKSADNMSYRGKGFGSGQMVNRGRGRGGGGTGGANTPKTPLWKQVLSSDDDSDSNSNSNSKKKKKTNKKKLNRYGREEDGEEEDWSDDDMDGVDSDDMELGGGFSQYTSANEKEMILSFFNETSLEELQILPGCKKSKAALIVEMRPFSDWDDLIAKIEVSIGKSVITEGKSVIKTRSTVVRLMIQCQKISKTISREVKEMISAAEKAEQRGEVESIMKQPANLSPELKLKPFQLIGLNWLKLMHRNEKNGILADEMGLGKTIQAIAFLAYLLHTGNKGPHLIVVPSSIFDNWRKELELWCPSLKVLPYTGSQDERAQIRDEIMDENALENYHILISTYSQMTSTTEDRILFKNQPFNYVIYDEAHQLKNMDTQKYQHLMRVKAQRRLLLTGTPLQNNLVELMSLLAFVMPSMFSGKTEHLIKIFKTVSVPDKAKPQAKPDEPSKSFEKERIQHAKNIMKPFVLRRLKKDVLHSLPEKTERKDLVTLLPEQRAVYDNLVKSFSKKVKAIGNVNDGKKNTAYTKASSGMMMDLRKCANHPLLVRNYYDDDTLAHMAHLIKTQDPGHAKAREDLIFEDLKICNDIEVHNTCQKFPDILEPFLLQNEQICQSGKMAAMDELFAQLKPKGDRVLLFSQFTMLMDIIEVYLEHRGHSYLRLDGSTPITERQALIDEYNNDESIFIFLLSTKAGGLGINLTAANTVVIHDIDFNPYNDKQAADRCHRVGQSRPVSVYRLIGKETIEENMWRAAEKKLQLEAEVVGEESTYASLAGPAKSKKEKEEEEQMSASLLQEVLLHS